MAPPGLGVAPPQHLVVAIEEDQPDVEVLLGAQPVEPLDQPFGAEITGPRVDSNGDRPRQAVADAAGQAAEQGQGQVVDRLIAEVLQQVEGGGMTGARQAGDQQHAQPAASGRPGVADVARRSGRRRGLVIRHDGGIIPCPRVRTARRT